MRKFTVFAIVMSWAGNGVAGTGYQGTGYQGTGYQGTGYQGTGYQGTLIQNLAISGGQFPYTNKAGQAAFYTITSASLDGSELVIVYNSTTKRGRDVIGAKFNTTARKPVTTATPTGCDRTGNNCTGVSYTTTYQTVTIPTIITDASTEALPTSMGGDYAYNDLTNTSLGIKPTWMYKFSQFSGTTWFNPCSGTTWQHAFGMIFSGAVSESGTWTAPTAGQLTMSCNAGVMSKAARVFGYKPWMSYTTTLSNGTQFSERGVDLWVTAFNAAMANYCGTGQSFTQEGTLVDVYDHWNRNTRTPEGATTQFATESGWSYSGTSSTSQSRLVHIYSPRYTELAGSPTTAAIVACAGSKSSIDNNFVDAVLQPSPSSTYRIIVSTSVTCGHAPKVAGGKLEKLCSPCTQFVCNSPGYEGCCTANWDASCVAKAAAIRATAGQTACNDANGYNSPVSAPPNALYP